MAGVAPVTQGNLRRIIYMSQAPDMPDAELTALYAVSSRRNRADNVSGLLLHDGSRFLQAIEGEDRVVVATMSRILHDPRHRNVHFIQHAPVASRAFPAWSMTHPVPQPGCEMEAFITQVKQDVDGLDDLQLTALFIGFARLAATLRTARTNAGRAMSVR